MVSDKAKKDFQKEFEDNCYKFNDIESVEFFGSFMKDSWRQGESDIDIAIYGNNISLETKRYIKSLFISLNEKYDLKVEKAKWMHPTPFFIDSPFRRQFKDDLGKGHIHTKEYKDFMIKYGPTHKFIWDNEMFIRNIDNLLPILPIPRIPKLSVIIDKFS